MEAVRMRAASLLRRGWRATIFLALMAGLAGGIAMAASATGRRTATAFDRYVERADPPDLALGFCPPETTEVDDESIGECSVYDPENELAVIQALPEVAAAGRGMWRELTVARPSAPDETRVSAGLFSLDHSLPSGGRPLILEGRMYEPDAPDEIVINETRAERSGPGAR
ncbi:MAG: hypothetical protein ACRD0A_00270 [Acidimicrobiales bacterium]